MFKSPGLKKVSGRNPPSAWTCSSLGQNECFQNYYTQCLLRLVSVSMMPCLQLSNSKKFSTSPKAPTIREPCDGNSSSSNTSEGRPCTKGCAPEGEFSWWTWFGKLVAQRCFVVTRGFAPKAPRCLSRIKDFVSGLRSHHALISLALTTGLHCARNDD